MWAVLVPVVVLLTAAAGGWFFWPSSPDAPEASRHIKLPPAPALPEPSPDVQPMVPPAAAPPEAIVAPIPAPLVSPPPVPHDVPIEVADEQHVLDHVPADGAPALTVFRFAPNPRILVLDFRSLRDQGRMLNRAAAFVEKSGLPHDRLLDDTDLDKAIRAGGDTPETFYYGHDYGGPALTKFFALADRDNIQLLDDETELRRLLRQDGSFEPNTRTGLISIPQVGADPHVTLEARATILHHELSHGEYFTNPHYVTLVHHFWTQTLSPAERDHIRKHLRSLGYDSSLDEVMENEAQAYLMFTEDPEFFTPDMVGMTKGRLNELRTGFFRAMPAGWLRDSLGHSLNASEPTTSSASPPASPRR
jgi:hypothetical protein